MIAFPISALIMMSAIWFINAIGCGLSLWMQMRIVAITGIVHWWYILPLAFNCAMFGYLLSVLMVKLDGAKQSSRNRATQPDLETGADLRPNKN